MPNRKVVLAIDGRNFNAATRRVGFLPDYQKLMQWAGERQDLDNASELPPAEVDARYYTTVVPESATQAGLQPLLDRIARMGYTVVQRVLRAEGSDYAGRIKGSCDVELTVEAMHAIASGVDELVLASGDADFAPLLDYCQQHGVRTTVLSTMNGSPTIASSKLRKYADEFVDLADVRQHVERVQQAPRVAGRSQ